MKLIKESPADRRRFMDIGLCQQDKRYFYTLVNYNKLLAQRNKMLKDYKNMPSLDAMNAVMVEKLCDAQVLLMEKRRAFLEELAPIAAERHTILTSGKETLTLEYEGEEVDSSDVKGSLKALYEKAYEKDKRLEYTSVGIHRDDIRIKADGVDIRKYGSQGQQRTVALSMKLAELMLFKKRCGEYPILLMDDVLSELDGDRRRALFEGLDGVQTFITTTEFNEETEKKTVYTVDNGKVIKND